MNANSFLTLRVHTKKDALAARRTARRVAALLGYDDREQACVAAGAFMIAWQALEAQSGARLVFQLHSQQLHIHAEGFAPARDKAREETAAPLRLAKALPLDQQLADQQDLGWLVRKIQETAHVTLFEEIVRQNQEVLALLHELRLYREESAKIAAKGQNPHAA